VTEQLAPWRAPAERAPAAANEPFRPIQYLGSKARLLGAVEGAVDEVDASRGPVLDLFSGSGVVAAHLARSRDVTAADVQEYARVVASALLAPARFGSGEIERLATAAAAAAAELGAGVMRPLLERERAAVEALAAGDAEPLCQIVERGSPAAFALGDGPPPGLLGQALGRAAAATTSAALPLTVTRYYGGVYFGYAQALELDALLAVVRALPPGPPQDTGLAAVLGAASECVTSVGGHFAQPIRPRDASGRPKAGALAQLARRRQRRVRDVFAERLRRYAGIPGAAHAAAAVRGDYRDVLAGHDAPVGAVYADPPYTRDHYSRFYHALETMARGDEPEISTVTIGGVTSLSRGLYRRERHQSPFCIRTQAPGAFRSLFARVRALGAPLVLSYSPYASGTPARPQPRLLTIAQIADLARESFAAVEVRSAGRVTHSKFNAERLNGSAPEAAELLLLCAP
jgi:adenine-specific DNA-methyltransferase